MADERRLTFLRHAYELARSGDFADQQAIEAVLTKDYPEAQEWLSNSFIRDGLRQMCKLARTEQSDPERSF